MKTFTLTLAALLLATPALAASKLKTLPLDKSGCVQNMQVKKGERYRIPTASDGTMFTVLNGYAAYATLYTAAGKAVQPERATLDNGKGEQFAELSQGDYVLRVHKNRTIKRLCLRAAD